VAGTALADTASDPFGIDIEDGLEDFNLDELLSDDNDDEFETSAETALASDIDDMSIDIDMDLESELDSTQFEEIGALDTEMDSIDDLLADNDSIDLPEGLDFANLDDDITASLDADSELDIPSLSLDIDSENFDKIMPDDNAYKSASNESNESNEIEALLDDEDNLLAEFDDNLSFLDLDDDADAIEETQVDTKLDLAKAYIDMGDIEGARSTLEEVMQDGSDDQKRAAEELLGQTG
jgi:pilus assembly protein FimV